MDTLEAPVHLAYRIFHRQKPFSAKWLVVEKVKPLGIQPFYPKDKNVIGSQPDCGAVSSPGRTWDARARICDA